MPRPRSQKPASAFAQAEYESLAEFRYQIARFLRRRNDAARAEGLQSQHYELMLAVSGLPRDQQPTIKEMAARLRLEHHAVVELADRLEKRKPLARRAAPADKRVVLLQLLPKGRAVLNRIVAYSFWQLREEAPALIRALRRILRKSS